MATIIEHFDNYLAEVTLKPSDGGRFEISVNDDVVFSKLETDRFPDEDEVIELVGSAVGAN